MPKPLVNLGIGVDNIPETIRTNPIFDGNDLGKTRQYSPGYLTKKKINTFVAAHKEVITILKNGEEAVFKKAKSWLYEDKIEKAWNILLARLYRK